MTFFAKKQNGFTIIELIISIFILSFALVGIFSAFSIVSILTADSADHLTGTYLAQEGMEIVRNVRDTNWLKMDANPGTANWDDNFSTCEGGGCDMDYTTDESGSVSIKSYADGDYLLSENGFYTYNYTSGSVPTKFQRRITITPLADANGGTGYILLVKVQVFWDEKATLLNKGLKASVDGCTAKNCITAEGTLYDWYNYTPAAPPEQ